MIILGLSGALGHDPSAALLVDGEIAAAAEEERFVREKHAQNRMPREAARYCLEEAGVAATQIDAVAFPYAPISIFSPARWHYAKRHWYAPDRALDAIVNGNRRYRRNRARVTALGKTLGIDWSQTAFEPVEHHLAHASSAYHLSGFDGKTAVLGVDGKGEYATTFFGVGEAGGITRIHEFYDPDSLSGVYGALTEYLGFEMLDGEYKLMGMAPYGDPSRFDFAPLLGCTDGDVRVDSRMVNTVGLRRYRDGGRGRYFGAGLVRRLGPPRHGDAADEPYVHHAAAMQQAYEDACLELIEAYLGDVLAATGRLVFAGGGALNVKLNKRILERDDVDELFVQPAAGDAGTALGAATHVASRLGDVVRPMTHVYLGPGFSSRECREALASHPGLSAQELDDVPACAADILAAGHPLAWFQGRMEFGPRALGARSILGCPSIPGIAARINAEIKYRERWRPFCPSLTDTVATDILGTSHPAPFMTIAFDVAERWQSRIPEVVHVDGTARAQVVTRDVNPRYYALLERIGELTGTPVLLNTSLNRRGEPIACTPTDALGIFVGSDLGYLVIEDLLITKQGVPNA
ncbi:MAG: carbamoyltransferase [Gammaproteobacteria bacterium]|nr:carbamoyltransferase [Gammaproteobacteria bacterium]MYF30590.1 carbamoyltransferase [Gammaproteobacteria bacterium]MYK48453.1 carbamoyltransferase [Gammaproteobacteria bacterium]